jgi:hypothetical protein
VRDGLAASVAVREGFSDDESVELLPLEGEVLAAGEPVIVVGNRDLEHGARVLARDAADDPVADGEVETEAPAAAPSDG